ncbi:hypothetical protein H2199_007005 [Coniosporium tulheliwenetii]|uniref:Uncharacterized protein n=1 Tax=Coniosporium tulheliwenetii TaxID=3383036 RepID=A0ACC2YSE1_9PEZI|nr:hypothetical protein H2199_007005 [Cladosporium sp. JES 115]
MASTAPTTLKPTTRARGMTTTLAGLGVIVDTIEPVPKAIGTGAIKRASDGSASASASSASPRGSSGEGRGVRWSHERWDELWREGVKGVDRKVEKKDCVPEGKIPGCGEAEGMYLARSVGKRVGRLLGLRQGKGMKKEDEGKKGESKGKGKERAVEQ